jgi:hypothetical protein
MIEVKLTEEQAHAKALFLAAELEASKWLIDQQEAADELRRLHAVNAELLEALKDMHSGWKYIRETHGDLYGVGWDRAQEKAEAAIAKAEEVKP